MKDVLHPSVDQQLCGAVWTSPLSKELMERLSYDIGPRPMASKTMRQAQELLAAEFRRLGVNSVHTEPVQVLAWREAPSIASLLSPRRVTYESVHCVHSTAADLTAPLLAAGNASQSELDRLGKRVRGAILLIGAHVIAGSKYVPLPQQVHEISERGAVGALFRSPFQAGGCPAVWLAGVSEPAPIPVLGISYETGEELAAIAKAGKAKIDIKTSGMSYSGVCSNLAGELGPSQACQESILLSAHLDTFYINPGSLDNLTGVITLMEVVRALAPVQARFKRTLRLVIFTGEEYGFLGSKSYVERHGAELDAIRFVFNMDTLFPATAEGVAVMGSPSMRDYMDATFRQTQRRVDVRNLFCMSSDYLPFILQGVAAARPADWRNSMPVWSHSRMDTPDKINLEWLRCNAMVFAQLLARMLMDPRPLPAPRKTREEVKSILAYEQVTEALRYFAFDV